MLSQGTLRMHHKFPFSLLLIIGIVAFISSSAMAANPDITSIKVDGVTYTSGFSRTITIDKEPGESFELLITGGNNFGGAAPAGHIEVLRQKMYFFANSWVRTQIAQEVLI